MLGGNSNLKIKNKMIKLIKKSSFKILSIIIMISLVLTATVFQSVRSMASIPSKPAFSISAINFDPSKPKAGEEIEVSGTITPVDFEIPVYEKEIVLVLDVSGSMSQGTSDNSTKILQLKNAANNFVTKMKGVPNLKIGIVAYSSKAWINPNGKDGNEKTNSIETSSTHDVPKYKSAGTDLLNITDSRLPNMINSLEALGGTNTGEGMRKAAYMLRNENGANKTIVLMTDGLPTFYSVKGSNNKSYYTTIDNTDPYYAGSGSDDNSNGDCLNYSKTIGGIIKGKKYNVFSIGYGLNDSGNKKLREIHESMGGTVTSEDGGDKSYFETSNGAIDSVFQNIATQIINNYDIKNGTLTSKILEEFELAVGGKTVSIPDIHYKKDEINSTASRTRYHAEPYAFSFKIKALKAGDYSNIFKDSYISFPWNNETISCVMPNSNIKILDNKLPNIEANLTKETQTVSFGQDVTVTYNIDAEKFEYKDDSTQLLPKDVVILFDTSKGMETKLSQFINGGFNDLLNNDQLRVSHTKYAFITFNSDATISAPSKYQNFKPDNRYDTENLKTDTTAMNDYVVKNLKVSQSTDRNIGIALKKADQVLKEDKEVSNKYILLVSSGPVTYNDTDIADLKDKGYIILSLSIGTLNSGQNPNTFLYNLHKILGGEKNASLDTSGGNYFVSPGNENNNDISNYIIKNITKKIIGLGKRKAYIFKDVYLNFDIGEDFEYVSGLERVENNKYKLKVPNVTYNYDEDTMMYSAEPVNDVSFKILPKIRGTNIVFGGPNTISYTGINESINRNILTPRITIAGGEIKHGIYEGISKSTQTPDINESKPTIPKNSIITIGAYFMLYSDNSEIELTLNKNYNNIDDLAVIDYVDVFKVDDDGNLSKLGVMTRNTSSTNKYNYTFGDIPIGGEKILILYKVKPISNGTYTNVIKINEEHKDFIIGADAELPDLY